MPKNPTRVRCLYRVLSRTVTWEDRVVYKFGAAQVREGAPHDAQVYWNATPGGGASLTCDRERDPGYEPGEYRYLDFSPAPDGRWECKSVLHASGSEEMKLTCGWDHGEALLWGDYTAYVENESVHGTMPPGSSWDLVLSLVPEDVPGEHVDSSAAHA